MAVRLWIAALVVGCVVGSTASLAIAYDGSVYPASGKWHGTTKDGYKMSYKVSSNRNRVSGFHLKWNYHCDNDGDGWISDNSSKKASVNHATGHFGFIEHFKVPGLTKDAYVNFDGYFSESGAIAKKASGSLGTGYFYDLNGDFCVGHDTTWKAHHK